MNPTAASPALKAARTLRRAARFVCQDGGTAAVEFALILPIMVVLWIGGVEVTQGLSVDRRLNNLSSAIGDLSARSKVLQYSDIDNIFDIAPGAMFPYSTTGLQMRVTAINISSGGNASVAWSRAEGTTTYADNQNMNGLVPAALRVPDSQVIMSEVFHTYSPAVGYVITGDVDLQDRLFFVPRLTNNVQLCDNSGENCKS